MKPTKLICNTSNQTVTVSHRKSKADMYILLLLLLYGSIHPNPAPALLSVSQPNFELCLGLAKPAITLADGHGLLHYASSSINNYLHLHLPLSSIAVEHTSRELLAYSNEYTSFLANISSLPMLMKIYFTSKIWSSDLCDIIPLAISNVFSIRIIALSSDINKHIKFSPRCKSFAIFYIIIHLQNNHFGAKQYLNATVSMSSFSKLLLSNTSALITLSQTSVISSVVPSNRIVDLPASVKLASDK